MLLEGPAGGSLMAVGVAVHTSVRASVVGADVGAFRAATFGAGALVPVGNVTGPEQAIEFMIAGAAAVAVGTANFIDPTTPLRVIDGIAAYCERHNFSAARELTGSIQV